MSGILWIASYPKSGNTWFRAFLENLRRDASQPVDINDFQIVPANRRRMFDDATGGGINRVDGGRGGAPSPAGLPLCVADNSGETVFLKIHDACTVVPGGGPLIPPEATAGAVYIIRNPWM